MDRVLPSCAAYLAQRKLSDQSQVTVSPSGVAAFLSGLDMEKFSKISAEPVPIPLRFETIEQCVNFWVTLDLLNFGSGYRHQLHELQGRGAYESMLMGVLSSFITGSALDADFFCSVTLAVVLENWGLTVDYEEEIMPAVYERKKGPLFPLAQRIVSALQEAGAYLQSAGYKDFAALVKDTLDPGSPNLLAAAQKPCLAGPLVAKLLLIPPFRDIHTVDGVEVVIAKKAQIAVADLGRQLQGNWPGTFQFTDSSSFTVFSDNVLPAVLRKLGLLVLSDELASAIDGKVDVPAGPTEVELRAAAIIACQAIVEGSDGSISAVLLDYYLWALGKEEPFRSLERHATKDTSFY